MLTLLLRAKPLRLVAWRLMRALPRGSAARRTLAGAFDRDLLRVARSSSAPFAQEFLCAWTVSSAVRSVKS